MKKRDLLNCAAEISATVATAIVATYATNKVNEKVEQQIKYLENKNSHNQHFLDKITTNVDLTMEELEELSKANQYEKEIKSNEKKILGLSFLNGVLEEFPELIVALQCVPIRKTVKKYLANRRK